VVGIWGLTCEVAVIPAMSTLPATASYGIRIQEAMTDNAMNYVRVQEFLQTMAELGIRHRRIAPYHPRRRELHLGRRSQPVALIVVTNP
jgi:hypothetical protein